MDPEMGWWLAFATAISGDVETVRKMELSPDDTRLSPADIRLIEPLLDALEGRHEQARTAVLEMEDGLPGEAGAHAALVLLILRTLSRHRLVPEKDVSGLLEAWEMVRHERPGSRQGLSAAEHWVRPPGVILQT